METHADQPAILTQQHSKHHAGHTLISMGVLLFLAVSALTSALTTSYADAFGVTPIADLSNQARIANGVAPLSINTQLASAAQAKVNHMVSNDYFEHTAPDGTTGWYFVGQEGYSYHQLGENLAASNEDDAAVVNGWLNSPGHRANLLNPVYSDVGYGIAYYGEYQGYFDVTFVVAMYGEPTQQEAQTVPQTTTVEGDQTPPAEESTQASEPEAPAEVVSASIDSNEETTSQPATAGTPPGTTNLSSSGFRLTQRTTIVIFIVGGVLFASGISIEMIRLYRHMKHLNTGHRPSHA